MVMNTGRHVNILKEERFVKAIPDTLLREEIRTAYIAQNMREFDVKIESTVGVLLQSTFTAGALVQLTNQSWVKSIARHIVRRLC